MREVAGLVVLIVFGTLLAPFSICAGILSLFKKQPIVPLNARDLERRVN